MSEFMRRFWRVLPISVAVGLVMIPVTWYLDLSPTLGAAIGGAITGMLASLVLRKQPREAPAP